MNISILTVFPELYETFLATSLLKKASQKGLVNFDVTSYFSFVKPKERIDAPTFGHGAGMLIKPKVVEASIAHQEKKHGTSFKIFFSPQGTKMDQALLKETAERVADCDHVLLASSRYEGMDARVEAEYADLILSIGDFVTMGGDIPAMLLLEGLLRHVPGVVGKQESVLYDSFSGPFVDYPEFTDPVEWHGRKVPDIVRSGDHGAIKEWRQKEAAKKTIKNHFEWFRTSPMTEQQKELGRSCIPNHYAALLHSDVLVQVDKTETKVGTTSITSIDIHDIARSVRTYGLKHLFLVTPLKDQQKVANTLLDFWKKGHGKEYNPSRFEAVCQVSVHDTLKNTIIQIEQKEGIAPLVVATSACQVDHRAVITYSDQQRLWSEDRPLLFLFGTGKGLSHDIITSSDYVLLPVGGFETFNHLSVRSAAAAVFDRWLGWNRKRQ